MLFTILSTLLLFLPALKSTYGFAVGQITSVQDGLQTFTWKPRIFILSDILNEPDDSMSLVRYLLYANEFDTVGLCATTSWWLKNETHPEEMRTIIEAYGEVVDNLNQHVHPDNQFPDPAHLLSLVTTGPTTYGLAALSEPLTEGAEHLIAALEASEEPLFISCWGGTNTLAQALSHMDITMPPAYAAELRSRIRLYTISDQDNTSAWIRMRYPDIFYIVSIHGFNAYYAATWPGINTVSNPGVDNTTVLNPWLDAHIRLGPLGSLYPQIEYGMEGDTPSFLWLAQNGLGFRDRIDWGSWGGRYTLPQAAGDLAAYPDTTAKTYVNALDSVIGKDGVTTYYEAQATIWRWRAAMQDDFAARMQWTLTGDFAGAAHPPVVEVNGHAGPEPLMLRVAANQTYTLSAGGTFSADTGGEEELDFLWVLYGDVTTFDRSGLDLQLKALEAGGVGDVGPEANDAGFATAVAARDVQFTAPEPIISRDTGAITDFHLLLQVTNRAGDYPIRRYLRVVCTYS